MNLAKPSYYKPGHGCRTVFSGPMGTQNYQLPSLNKSFKGIFHPCHPCVTGILFLICCLMFIVNGGVYIYIYIETIYWIIQVTFSTDKTLIILVTIGGDFCFDPRTVTTISKVMDTIERNANKVNLVEQIQEFMKKGTWKYQIGGVPKISESIARGAWKSDESWVLFLQGMEAFMAGNIPV